MKHIFNIFFDKVFIITIERNIRRLETFIKQNQDLDIEIFKGIDGQDLFPEFEFVHQFPDIFFKENSLNYEVCKAWSKSQLGCALSSKLVQIEIVNRGIKKALILEDDALILKQELTILKTVFYELPPDWDLLYIGYIPISKWAEYQYLRPLVLIKNYFFPKVIENLLTHNRGKNIFPKMYSRNLNIPGIYIGAHAFGLTLKAAKKLLEIDNPLAFGADRLLMNAIYHQKINGYSLKKPITLQNSLFKSSIQE